MPLTDLQESKYIFLSEQIGQHNDYISVDMNTFKMLAIFQTIYWLFSRFLGHEIVFLTFYLTVLLDLNMSWAGARFDDLH